MKSDLSEIRSSPAATAVFLLAIVVLVGAMLFLSEGNSWGAPIGSLDWWVGFGFAGLAVVLGVRSWLRAE